MPLEEEDFISALKLRWREQIRERPNVIISANSIVHNRAKEGYYIKA